MAPGFRTPAWDPRGGKSRDLPRLHRCGRLAAQVAHDAHQPLDQPLVGRQLAGGVVQVVLQSGAHMAAQQHRLDGRRQLGCTDAADAKDRAAREQVGHELQRLRRIGHRTLKAAVCVQHQVDERRPVVEPFGQQRAHVLQDVGRAEDLPLRLDAPYLHCCGQLAVLRRRAIEQDLPAFEAEVDGGRIQRAHLGSGLDALDALVPGDFPAAARQLPQQITIDAAARRVIDHDVAVRPDAGVDVAVDVGVAGRLIVGAAGVDGRHRRAGVPAIDHVARNLPGLRRQVRVLLLAGHAAGGGDGDDHLGCIHARLTGPPCPRACARVAMTAGR